MTESVYYPEPVYPPSVSESDPETLPQIPCGSLEIHEPHVWIGAWDHGDEDPRQCPGQVL